MACTVMGGMTVETEEQARVLSEDPELASEGVEVGDELELPECLPPPYLAEIQRTTGRPCPRPGATMDPENELPLELMGMSIAEHTRHLVEGTLRDGAHTAERPVIRRRVAAALRDPGVVALLYPSLKKDGDG